MTVVQRTRTVAYSCEQMYLLVDAIESYAEFLPYCTDSIVHHRDNEKFKQTLVIGASGNEQIIYHT